MKKTVLIKRWAEHHWFRLNKNAPVFPPLVFSLPLVFFFLFMENLLKVGNVFFFNSPELVLFEKRCIPKWSRRRKLIAYGVAFLFGLLALKSLSR